MATDANFEQLLKQELPSDVTEFPIVTDVKPEQSLKQEPPSDLTESEIVIPVKLVQFWKQASLSDVSNDVLNVTADKLLQLWKAFVPIDETLFGIEIDLRLIQL